MITVKEAQELSERAEKMISPRIIKKAERTITKAARLGYFYTYVGFRRESDAVNLRSYLKKLGWNVSQGWKGSHWALIGWYKQPAPPPPAIRTHSEPI